MLSQTLQTLERDGMIDREVQQSIPPHVEYTLTALGARIADQLLGLIDILESNIDTIKAAQDAYHRD
jgi:DNA-binding HxlR family transcriptional regulator